MAEENSIERDANVQETDVQTTQVNAQEMSDEDFEAYLAGEYGAGSGTDAPDNTYGQTTEPSGVQEQEDAEDDSNGDDTADDGGAGQAYRTFATQEEWQAEIDRIIGGRLKNAHKTLDEYESIKRTISDYYNTENADEAVKLFRADLQQQIAERSGVDVEMYRRMQNAEDENTQYKNQLEQLRQMQEQERRAGQVQAIQAEWQKQADELAKTAAGFNLKESMQDKEFAGYVVDKGLSIADAYYLTQRSRRLAESREAQAHKLQRKPVRENGMARQAAGGSAYTDVRALSDADFEKYLEKHMS